MKNSIDIIKEFRNKFGLSQNQLGGILGVTRDTVAGWENKRVRVPGDIVLRVQALDKLESHREKLMVEN